MIDHSVYPDVAHGEEFADDYDRADYIHRVCTAWDFGVFPERSTVELFRRWRDVFERFPVAASPGYHAFRMHFGWAPVEPQPILLPARWEVLDALEDREDPCRGYV